MTPAQHKAFTAACNAFGDALAEIFKTEPPTMERQEPARDWEILEFRNGTCSYIMGTDTYLSIEAAIKAGLVIHAIKRLGDNTVWTVGDSTNRGVIKSFMISDGTLFVCGEDWDTLVRTLMKPSPIFTTADGIDHYDENESIWVLYGSNGKIEQKQYRQIDPVEWGAMSPKVYNTKEAAEMALEEWLYNQPVLTLSEVEKYVMTDIDSPFEELTAFAKKKLSVK